ncbi:MAG: 16S rRNA processing protein RimM [Anaerolineae bacterium]|nr:16S rRNA processing protein RimM [Anaerolineae bacterium]
MPETQPEPRYLAVGRILRPHGVAGELRVEILTDHPERLVSFPYLYIGEHPERRAVEGVRFHKSFMLLRLAGCDDRDAAEALRGQLVQIAMADAMPLEEGEYYHFQIEGIQVVTTEGEVLGEIVEVLSTPGVNDVYIVHGLLGEVLIPAIHDVVQDLNFDTGIMVIKPLPGLLPQDA